MSAVETELRGKQLIGGSRHGRLKAFLVSWARSKPILFVVVMSFVMMGTKMPMAPFVEVSGGASTTDNVVMGGIAILVVSFVGLPLETLLGQAFPVWFMRVLGVRRWRWLILGSSLVFGAMHLIVDVGAFFVGFGGGVTLALCWLAWRDVTFTRALLGTTAVHAVHNAMAFAVYFLLPA